MPIGFCVRLVATALAGLLSAATAAARAGPGRAVLQGQADLGDRRLVARRRLRHLCAAAGAAFRRRHSRQSDRRGAEHERRRIQPRRGLHLFGRAEGRHRDRRDLPRRRAAAAAQRCAGAARSEQARLSRQRQQRRLCLLRAQRRGGEDVQGRARQGTDRRRQQSGRHHLRPAAAAEQRARHQVPHRHRLSRQPRDHARARARRGAGRLRHRLDRHRGDASGLVCQGHDPGAGAAQHQGPSPT